MFRFEKLDVWQRAIEFANVVYSVTRTFPADERFGLTSQLRRAAISVSSNIAEGSSRSSDSDFARFVEIAYGSVMEIVSQSHVAKAQSLVRDKDFLDVGQRADELSRMLSGLRARLIAPSHVAKSRSAPKR
jgi:four helix bundle protein